MIFGEISTDPLRMSEHEQLIEKASSPTFDGQERLKKILLLHLQELIGIGHLPLQDISPSNPIQAVTNVAKRQETLHRLLPQFPVSLRCVGYSMPKFSVDR